MDLARGTYSSVHVLVVHVWFHLIDHSFSGRKGHGKIRLEEIEGVGWGGVTCGGFRTTSRKLLSDNIPESYPISSIV